MKTDTQFIPMPYCPRCRNTRLKLLRAIKDQGDGSRRHRKECRACGYRFPVVFEPPEPKIGKTKKR